MRETSDHTDDSEDDWIACDGQYGDGGTNGVCLIIVGLVIWVVLGWLWWEVAGRPWWEWERRKASPASVSGPVGSAAVAPPFTSQLQRAIFGTRGPRAALSGARSPQDKWCRLRMTGAVHSYRGQSLGARSGTRFGAQTGGADRRFCTPFSERGSPAG